MQHEFTINGDLLNDILDGWTLIHHDRNQTTWGAITRYYRFKVGSKPIWDIKNYEMDETGVFKLTVRRGGDERTVLKEFKRDFMGWKVDVRKPKRNFVKRDRRKKFTHSDWKELQNAADET